MEVLGSGWDRGKLRLNLCRNDDCKGKIGLKYYMPRIQCVKGRILSYTLRSQSG